MTGGSKKPGLIEGVVSFVRSSDRKAKISGSAAGKFGCFGQVSGDASYTNQRGFASQLPCNQGTVSK